MSLDRVLAQGRRRGARCGPPRVAHAGRGRSLRLWIPSGWFPPLSASVGTLQFAARRWLASPYRHSSIRSPRASIGGVLGITIADPTARRSAVQQAMHASRRSSAFTGPPSSLRVRHWGPAVRLRKAQLGMHLAYDGLRRWHERRVDLIYLRRMWNVCSVTGTVATPRQFAFDTACSCCQRGPPRARSGRRRS